MKYVYPSIIQLSKCYHIISSKSSINSSQFRQLIRCSTSISKIRNVGIIAHIDAGKTTTSEQILYACGETDSVGRVDTGDTVMDFLPQERERGITISSAAISLKWKDFRLNWIDTPGHIDFTIEVQRSARVLDSVIVVVDAVAGVQAQTKTVWKQVNKQNLPAIVFVNKMDRDGADFNRSIDSLRSKLMIQPLPIQFPLGLEDRFNGIVDLISMCKIEWVSMNENHLSTSRTPLPPRISKLSPDTDSIQHAVAVSERKKMLEIIAEHDEVFIEKFLEVEDYNYDKINEKDVISAIRRVCLKKLAVPVLCGASLRNKGIEPLLNSITSFLPSPVDRLEENAVNVMSNDTIKIHPNSTDSNLLCALVFKIVYDKERGNLVYVRVYSGKISSKQTIRNSTRNVKEKVFQLLEINANQINENIEEITAGNVGCVVGLKNTRTGDTLVNDKNGLVIPPPVFSLSIEPEKTSQLNDLHDALNILCIEDPSLVVEVNKESGLTLLKGIGELHLEIVVERIKREYNIEVSTGNSYVAFRESISSDIIDPISKAMTYNRIYGAKRLFASLEFDVLSIGYSKPCEYDVLATAKALLTADEYSSLIEGLESACIRGPLGYPVTGLRIIVKSVVKDQDTTPGAIRACAALLIDTILKSDDSVILEPLMTAEIEVPLQFLGNVVGDLSVKRRANILEIVNQGSRNIIYADVPLSTMLGYATIIRSMTQGEGIFSLEYSHHSPVDKYLLNL